MTYRGPELAGRIAAHRPGPEQDHRARLVVAGLMDQSGHDRAAIVEVLDCLALLPGQELTRNGVTALPKGDPKCAPTSVRRFK